MIEQLDGREAYGEERWALFGMTAAGLLVWPIRSVETGRGSSRRAVQQDGNVRTMNARTAADPRLNGERHMTEGEILAAALADPDAQPWTEEQLATAKRVPRARSLRRALRLTQEEFAERYLIPVGTLRDWEQGRTEPDAPARAYLLAIAGDADGVTRALQRRPGSPPES